MAETLPGAPPTFDWIEGFSVRDDGLADFGARGAEARAALSDDVIAPLPGLAVIRVRGADAESFLQGQLGNDVRETTTSRAQLSSYSNPKGRVLAVLSVLRRPDGFWLLLPRDLVAPILKRLRLFVLRAKVSLDDAGAVIAALGLSGAGAEAALLAAGLSAPTTAWDCSEANGLTALRRPGATPRFQVLGAPETLAPLWRAGIVSARPVGPQAFRLLELRAGLPEVHTETAEQHVAQMLNLDQLGGISFSKGCYPGQEIVARLHYLGALKRRLFVGHSAESPKRGTAIYAAGDPAQPVGEVLDACSAPDGAALQAVLTLAAAEAGGLRLGSTDGPALSLQL